jgi:hypothetical protein
MAFAYSACNDSVAENKSESGFTQLKEQIGKFEQTLTDLKTIHADHVKQYSGEMGCNRDSKALDIINQHNELLERNMQRLKYHKMKLAQTDSTNVDQNNAQLLELQKDFTQLNSDANEIRTGFDNFSPAHVTK